MTHVIDISVAGIFKAKVVLSCGDILERCVVNVRDSNVELLCVRENGNAFGMPVIIAFRSIVSSICCKNELSSDEVFSEEDYSRVTVDRYRERPGNLKCEFNPFFDKLTSLPDPQQPGMQVSWSQKPSSYPTLDHKVPRALLVRLPIGEAVVAAARAK